MQVAAGPNEKRGDDEDTKVHVLRMEEIRSRCVAGPSHQTVEGGCDNIRRIFSHVPVPESMISSVSPCTPEPATE